MNDDPLPDLRNQECSTPTEDGIQFLPEVQDLFPARKDAKKEPLKVPIGIILEAKKGMR